MDKKIYRYRKKNREETMTRVITKNGQQEKDDKERRRNTRLGAVIAIVALTGAMCSFLLGFARNAFNIMDGGIVFKYLKILSSLVVATVILMIIYIVIYVLHDLKRYDVESSCYNQYDILSDKSYNRLFSTFKIYMLLLLSVSSLSVLFWYSLLDKGEKIAFMFFCFILIGFIIEKIIL